MCLNDIYLCQGYLWHKAHFPPLSQFSHIAPLQENYMQVVQFLIYFKMNKAENELYESAVALFPWARG